MPQPSAPAVAAFNVITLEHVEAVVAGAESVRRPVLLQVSENAVKYRYGRLLPLARAAVAAAEAAAVPVALHLDHVRSDSLLRQAADAGFSSVMYDAARLPYAENLAATPPTGLTPKGAPRRPSRGGRLARLPHRGETGHGPDGGDAHRGGRPDRPRCPSSGYSLTAFRTTNFRSPATSSLLPNRRRSLTW